MLIIRRKAGEIITIKQMDGLDTSQTINELFVSGAIEIKLLKVGRKQVEVDKPTPTQHKYCVGKYPRL